MISPEQQTALDAEITRFVNHPLNIKYQIVRVSDFDDHKSILLLHPDGVHTGFTATAERKGPNAWRAKALSNAYLLQRLKDALTAEKYQIFDVWTRVGRPAGLTYAKSALEGWDTDFLLEMRQGDDPEVLRLLWAINRSGIWEEK